MYTLIKNYTYQKYFITDERIIQRTSNTIISVYNDHYYCERRVKKKVYIPEYITPTEDVILKKIQDIDGCDIFVSSEREVHEGGYITMTIDMKFVHGVSLYDAIERKMFDNRFKRKIFLDLVKTMYSVHNKGIIHRDLKPEHIIVNINDTGRSCVKIIDWGLSDLACSPTLSSAGTWDYIPPELYTENVTEDLITYKIDMWAIGIIYYYLAFGKYAFEAGHTKSQILNISKFRYVLLPDMSDRDKKILDATLTDYKNRKCTGYILDIM